MKTNMGLADRSIRIIIACVIAALYLTHTITGLIGGFLLSIAAIFVLTSVIRFCPLYALIGVDTCKHDKKGPVSKS